MAGGIALLIGKPKGKADDEEKDDTNEETDESSVAADYAREAYKALQSKDEDGFVQALTGLHGCESE